MTTLDYSHSSLWSDPVMRLGNLTTQIMDLSRYLNRKGKSVSNAIASIPVFFASAFAALLLYGVLRYINRALLKSTSKEIVLTKDNHDRLYHNYIQIGKILERLKAAPNVSLKGEPKAVQIFVKQLVTVMKTLRAYQIALEKKFEQMDTPYGPLNERMRVVTTKELIEGRVRGYEYLV